MGRYSSTLYRETPGMSANRICLVPRLTGVGGMVSFQHKLAIGLQKRGVEVTYDLGDPPFESVLVIGGTRQLAALWRAQRHGVRIVQRLDGMNWLHRLPVSAQQAAQTKQGERLRHYLRAEYGNLVLSVVRSRLAQRLVYQSEFARQWWETKKRKVDAPAAVIYNGVDLEQYTPAGDEKPPEAIYRLLLVEGSLMGGYEQGLGTAIELRAGIEQALRSEPPLEGPVSVELVVAGRVSPALQAYWSRRGRIQWAGLVPRDEIPALDRSAHLLFSADINAACPNSVIEALACGLPVLALDTGALPELLGDRAGRVVPYGGNPWRLDPPNLPGLVTAGVEILRNNRQFRQAARARAEAAFGLDKMTGQYLDILLSE